MGCSKVIRDLTPKGPKNSPPPVVSSSVIIFNSGTYDNENNVSHYRNFSLLSSGEVIELNLLYPDLLDKYLSNQVLTKDGVMFSVGSEGNRRIYYTKNGKDLILLSSEWELREWSDDASIKTLAFIGNTEYVCLDVGVAKFENQSLTLINNTPCSQSALLNGEVYFNLIPASTSSRFVKLNADDSFTLMHEESSPVWIYFNTPKALGSKIYMALTKYTGSSYDTSLLSFTGPENFEIIDSWSSPMGSALMWVDLPDDHLHFIKFNYKLEMYPVFDEEGNITTYSNGNNSYMYKTINVDGVIEVVYDHSYESEYVAPIQLGENKFLITAKSYNNEDTGYVYKATVRGMDGEVIEHFPIGVNSYSIGFIKNMLLFSNNDGDLFELTTEGHIEAREKFYPFDIENSYFYAFSHLGKVYLGGTIGGYYEGDVFHPLNYPGVSFGND